MNALPSIQRQMSLALIGIALGWGVAVSLAVAMVVRHEVDEILDNGMQEAAEIIFGMVEMHRSRSPDETFSAYPSAPHHEDIVWQIVGGNAQVASSSYRAPPQPLSRLQARGFDESTGAWRVFALPLEGPRVAMLYVAQPMTERNEARWDACAYPALAALIVGFLGTLVLRRAMKRELEALGRTAASITNFDPLQPVDLEQPTRAELVPVVDAVRELGRRLTSKLANEQAFSAHAAHALRTPLSGLITNLAVAQRRARDPDDRAVLQRTRDAANRLRRVVAALLALFRSGGGIRREAIDLRELVAEMPYWSMSLRLDATEPIHADADLLAAALMNLLDNAERHGATEAVIVARRCPPNHHEIRVGDNGRGIDEDARRTLQLAIDTSSYEGTTGLGLMLVDLVARAHSGRCSLLASAHGFSVAFTLEDAGSARPLSPAHAPSQVVDVWPKERNGN